MDHVRAALIKAKGNSYSMTATGMSLVDNVDEAVAVAGAKALECFAGLTIRQTQDALDAIQEALKDSAVLPLRA